MSNISDITIGDSLFITLFSMTLVFLVLLGISYLIVLMKNIVNRNNNKDKRENMEKIIIKTDKIEEAEELNEEIVAAITAAIVASMGVAETSIKIKSIKRIDNSWKSIGREEQVLNKL